MTTRPDGVGACGPPRHVAAAHATALLPKIVAGRLKLSGDLVSGKSDGHGLQAEPPPRV